MEDTRRKIPGIDKMLKNKSFKQYHRKLVVKLLRESTEKWRKSHSSAINNYPEQIKNIESAIINETLSELKKRGQTLPGLRKVINATGTILNTNLGRAPISKSVLESVTQICSAYSNLEYNLETGKRSDRLIYVDKLLKELTGCESTIVVNNNASAVLLILDTYAKGKEVIVSRGELIEIGGSFRLPDILNKSGCKLIEVGTTNRTYIEDYERKITKKTALLLKAYTSNYKISGYVHTPSLKEISNLGKKYKILSVYDLGSGLLIDLYNEPTIKEIVSTGVNLITFSGDKLLGGPQAGIIIGTKKCISTLKENPLFRALRVDKITMAFMETLLRIYLYEDDPISRIPHLHMIKEPLADIKIRAQKLYKQLSNLLKRDYNLSIQKSYAEIGGGTCPDIKIQSFAITISSIKYSPDEICKQLRQCTPPIVSRIADNKVWLDLRTMFEIENEISKAISTLVHH